MKKITAFFASLLSASAATAGAATVQNFQPSVIKGADWVAWEETKENVSNKNLVNFLLNHPESEFVKEARALLMNGTPQAQLAAAQVQPPMPKTHPTEGVSDNYSNFFQNI